jgi:hypothetical protein
MMDLRYRKREPLNLNTVSITFQDRLFAFCERALMALGFMLGEELIIVLEKPLLSKNVMNKESSGSTLAKNNRA